MQQWVTFYRVPCAARDNREEKMNAFVSQGFSGGGARMPARSVCLVTLSLSEAGPGRFGCQVSVTDVHLPYHTIPSLRARTWDCVGWFFCVP